MASHGEGDTYIDSNMDERGRVTEESNGKESRDEEATYEGESLQEVKEGMIGNAQKDSAQSESAEEEIFHPHCESCIFVKCHSREGCNFKQCILNCGATYHSCKEKEHRLLCPKQLVDCINATNGCPIKLPREKIWRHLPRCPASVMHCCQEWNRWPVYSMERKARVPFNQSKLHARYGQLDVALALRDQRKLNEAMQAPRTMRRSLQNPLTVRFPAVPFVQAVTILPNFNDSEEQEQESGEVMSQEPEEVESELEHNCFRAGDFLDDDDSDCPWMQSRQPPGLSNSVCSQLFRCGRATNNAYPLPAQMTHQPIPDDIADEVVKKKVQYMLDNNIPLQETDFASGSASASTSMSAPPAPPPPPTGLTLQNILGLDLNLEWITRYQMKPKSMYTFLCAQVMRRDQYASHFKNIHLDIHSNLNGWLENRCPLASYGCTYSQRRMSPTSPAGKVVYSTLLESFGFQPEQPSLLPQTSTCVKKHHCKEQTPEIFTSTNCDSNVQVDGNIDSLNDQSSASANHQFVRDSLSPEYYERPSFNSLPNEVLRHMFTYLDAFALSNMAVTSRKLRQISSWLLEEKGVVVQEWVRKDGARQNGRPNWYIGYKRWLFGSHFTPIESWGFNEQEENMADHMSSCQFYQPAIRDMPYLTMMAETEKTNVHAMVERMYPGYGTICKNTAPPGITAKDRTLFRDYYRHMDDR